MLFIILFQGGTMGIPKTRNREKYNCGDILKAIEVVIGKKEIIDKHLGKTERKLEQLLTWGILRIPVNSAI